MIFHAALLGREGTDTMAVRGTYGRKKDGAERPNPIGVRDEF